MRKNGYIYGLIDPDTCLIRYVGQTKQIIRCRIAQHVHRAKTGRTHRDNWIRSLGSKLEYAILEICDTGELNSSECWWIAYGRACGWPLTNHTDGGEPGLYDVSVETRTRMSEAAKRRPPRKQSDEERAKRSASMIGKQIYLGHHRTPETRARIAESRKDKPTRFKGDRPKIRINLLGDYNASTSSSK